LISTKKKKPRGIKINKTLEKMPVPLKNLKISENRFMRHKHKQQEQKK
jgi:hypothetical protein